MQIVNPKPVSRRVLATVIIAFAVLGGLATFASKAIPAVWATSTKINQQNTFEGITFNTTGTISYNSTAVTGGSLKLKVTDGTIIVTTTYSINPQKAGHNEVRFLMFAHVNDSSNIEMAAYFDVNVSTGTVTAYFGARNADINQDGTVDVSDYTFFSTRYGLCPGDQNYDPRADIAASGCIGIVDATLWNTYVGSPEYR